MELKSPFNIITTSLPIETLEKIEQERIAERERYKQEYIQKRINRHSKTLSGMLMGKEWIENKAKNDYEKWDKAPIGRTPAYLIEEK